MQGNVAEVIRELMELQQMSVRKVSARIAEQYGGSTQGYTQQISRILNDPSYDPSLSTVQKILAALNVSLWQVSKTPEATDRNGNFQQVSDRLDQLSADVANLKTGLGDLQQAIATLADAVLSPRSIDPEPPRSQPQPSANQAKT
jgi:transcriptional regulator with XRE-family HTH domain